MIGRRKVVGEVVDFEGIFSFFGFNASLKLIFRVNIEWTKAISYTIQGVALTRLETVFVAFPFWISLLSSRSPTNLRLNLLPPKMNGC